MRMVLASGNAHKVKEIAEMVGRAMPDVVVIGMKTFGDPPEIAETADTFAGNAALKAKGIAAWLKAQGGADDAIVLADDSGICIDAFDGGPGVYSARFAGPDATDAQNNQRMVDDLQAKGLEASPAHYACVLSLARVDGRKLPVPEAARVYDTDGTVCFEGHCIGEVRTQARGEGGFGYDPHFWVDDRTITFAELTPTAKAARSHRGAAVYLMLNHLRELLD
jgi:XTP/dITP diphosphohydrolase